MTNDKKSNANELDRLRADIDAVDRELMALLDRRGRLALRVGAYKKERGLPVHVPEREAVVLARVAEYARQNHTSYHPELLASIFQAIMAATCALEAPENIPESASDVPPETTEHPPCPNKTPES